MARKLNRKRQLARALENSGDVIAAIDDQFEVIFANDACCRWLGVPREQMEGARLQYSSLPVQADDPGDTAPTARLAGICPPPDLLEESAESSVCGFIVSRSANSPRWKRAVWTVFGDGESKSRIILLVGRGPDGPAPDPSNPVEELRQRLHNTLAALDATDRQRFVLPSLAGNSDQAKRIRRQVQAAASNRSDCLIVGPAGSGREHIARTIFHERHNAHDGLVPLHCVIADSQLLQESIKNWAFDQQDHRTNDWLLLLDVNRLNPEAQNELLGYTRLPDFPMRILATSETDLLELADRRLFSRPLAMHLSVQVIQSVPLRQRPEDIPLISQLLIEARNRTGERQIAGLSDEVMELFYEYRWPGHLNELKQVLRSAHDHCTSRVIQTHDLPDSFHQGLSAMRIGYHQETKIELDEFLAGIEQQLIELRTGPGEREQDQGRGVAGHQSRAADSKSGRIGPGRTTQ